MTKYNDNSFKETIVYKNVLQNMHDGVIAISYNGTIITFNSAAANILMIDEQDLVGENFTKIFSKILLDPRNDELSDSILDAVYKSTVTHHKDVKYYSDKTCKSLLLSSTVLSIEKNNDFKKIGMIIVISDLTERERLAHVKNIFGKYIDPQIVQRLIDYSEEDLKKANKQEMTVSFCDMNNFTMLCECLPPNLLEELMNLFFSRMSEAVHKNNGVIDKFIGDSIMSFWGSPFTPENMQTINGGQAALDQLSSLEELNKDVTSILKDKHKDVDISIGIASGELVIANIGSDTHKSFTIMGNIVNLSSRLVGANKIYGTKILVTEQVTKSSAFFFEYREIDTIRVKGKEKHTTIYELLGVKGSLTDQRINLIKVYESALNSYRKRDWKEAKQKFEKALKIMPNDRASGVFLERIEHLKNQALDDTWEGVWILENK